jgi:hypothetical protein
VSRSKRIVTVFALAGLAATLSGCGSSHPPLAALSRLRFEFTGVSNVRLVGIPIDASTRYRSIGMLDLARLGAAIAANQVPLEFTAHLDATNPPENPVTARIVGLDWSLFIEDRHALDGGLGAPVAIASGATGDIPLAVRLDLAQMGNGTGRDLFDLAIAIAGQGTVRKDVRLELHPVIETPLGPIRYPYPIACRRAAQDPRVSTR